MIGRNSIDTVLSECPGGEMLQSFLRSIFALYPASCGSAQHSHFFSLDVVPWTGWELLLKTSGGESRRASSEVLMPLRASSSRAIRVKAASTF